MTDISLNDLGRIIDRNKSGDRESSTNPRDKGGKPVQQNCGDIDIRIARDGTWFYMGSPIGRMKLVKLFASVITHDDAGDYFLETPVEKARIQVDDAPFTAVEMTVTQTDDGPEISFRTNVDDFVTAGADHPIRVETNPETGEPAPYVLVRDNLEALIVRAVFYDLVELADEVVRDGTTVLQVASKGAGFELGALDEAG